MIKEHIIIYPAAQHRNTASDTESWV